MGSKGISINSLTEAEKQQTEDVSKSVRSHLFNTAGKKKKKSVKLNCLINPIFELALKPEHRPVFPHTLRTLGIRMNFMGTQNLLFLLS